MILSWLAGALSPVQAFWSWLFGSTVRLVVAALLVVCAILWVRGNLALDRLHKANESVANLEASIRQSQAQAISDRASYETEQGKIRDDEESDLQQRLGDALVRLHTPGRKGSTLPSVVPANADSPAAAAAASQAAQLDDGATCTAAVIKAEGWQEWYSRASSVRDGGTSTGE